MQSYRVVVTPKNMDPLSADVDADGQFEAVAAAMPLIVLPAGVPYTIEVLDREG